MSCPVLHLSKVRQIARDTFRTGTICNRFLGTGDINCTTDELDVTCKFCLQIIEVRERDFQAGWAA